MSTSIPLEGKATVGDNASSSRSALGSNSQKNAQYGLKFVGAALSSRLQWNSLLNIQDVDKFPDMAASGVSNPLDIIKVSASLRHLVLGRFKNTYFLGSPTTANSKCVI